MSDILHLRLPGKYAIIKKKNNDYEVSHLISIGLMTFLHNDNYGSILQAYALQQTLHNLGFNAEHIDYCPSKAEKFRNLLASGNSPRLILDGMRKRSAAQGLTCGFDEFRQTQLRLSPRCADHRALTAQAANYDVLMCGSDQIWSPTWLNPAYFLDFTDKPKIAYAPSLGVSAIDSASKRHKIAALTKSFFAMSVREEEGALLLHEITGQKPPVMPDPVLLLARQAWLTLAGEPSKRHEAIGFFLGDRSDYMDQVRQQSKQTGLPVRLIPRTASALQADYPQERNVTPVKWLNLLAGAELVVTDSFHAAAFSLLLHTPCLILRRDRDGDPLSRNSRVDQLCRSLCVDDPLHPDFDMVDAQIAIRREAGLAYLRDAVNRAAASVHQAKAK